MAQGGSNILKKEMVSLKTKFEKHVKDNEKRRRSIKQNEKAKLNQALIIKQALSNANLCGNSNKKITFKDDDNISEKTNRNKKSNENGKSILFSSESDNENFVITEKSQFKGKKGFELLSLQSTYGNDERFKIDERFLENEKEYFDQDKKKTSNDERDNSEEKIKQLKILENVLGTPLIEREKEKKMKKRTYEMIRYDATNKDHEIYEMNAQTQVKKSFLSSSKTNKQKTKIPNIEKELKKPEVTKEKFYKVSNEIKNCFKDNKGNDQFSLLQSYGVSDVENKEEIGYICEEENMETGCTVEEESRDSEDIKDDFLDEDNFIRDNDEKKIIDGNNRIENDQKRETKNDEKGVMAKGIWKEPFFFVQDDLRIKEALEFINKKGSAEAIGAAENYDQMRKKLKEILRLHLKKQMHKKNPFKNKIGGMNKKQLANSKSRNSKVVFNKRKSFKVG